MTLDSVRRSSCLVHEQRIAYILRRKERYELVKEQVAVGTPIARCPPHRSQRTELPHKDERRLAKPCASRRSAKVVKMEETEWLPVVEFNGVEYAVDVHNKCLGRLLDPTEIVAFHSDEGREMVKTRAGMEWQVWTPRETLDDREGVV